MHRDRAVGAGDADVHVQPEGVVAPDDVAEQLVVAAVVRRVDDPLVLPAAPRVRRRSRRARSATRARRECSCARRSAIAARCLGEALAAARPHLDLGRDQLTDDVRREVGLDRRGVQLLEPVGQLERLRIEQRELLLDRDGQVGAGVERLTRLREELLPRDALFLAHRREPSRYVETRLQAARSATLGHDQRSTTA